MSTHPLHGSGFNLRILPPPSTSVKTCLGCGQSKPPEDFGRQPNAKDGRKARCKSCVSDDNRAYQERRAKAEREAEERGMLLERATTFDEGV